MTEITAKSITTMVVVVPNQTEAVTDVRDPEKEEIEEREDTKKLTTESAAMEAVVPNRIEAVTDDRDQKNE